MNITKANRIKLSRFLRLVSETKCDDGTILYTEGDMAIDAEVFVANEAGDMVPAADGEYVADGKIYTVTAGTISAVKEVDAEPIEIEDPLPAVEEEMAEEEEMPEEVVEPAEDIEKLKERIKELEEANDALKAENEELKKKLEEPAAESIEEMEEKERKFSKDKPEANLVSRLVNASRKSQK